jgi:hypothetical protein
VASDPASDLTPAVHVQNDQVRDAYTEIEKHADVFHNNIPMPLSSTLDLDGEPCLMQIFGLMITVAALFSPY